jgi:hypothetical protein
MKKTCFTITIAVFFLIWLNGIQAQIPQVKLNQVELVKQFAGKWECKISKDSTLFWNANSYGTGFEVSFKGVAKGKVFVEGKQLWGYDKQQDKFIIATMHKGQGIKIYSAWFLSNKKYESINYNDISNPETASWKIEGEFKSPDMYTETTLVNNKTIRTHTNTRVK